MKKYMTAAALLLLMAGCKKDVNENQNNQPKNMPVQGINIVNGMLSFDKAEFYDTFVSQSDGQVLDALRQYEERNDYLSLAEQRDWAEDTVYTEVISSLLNTNYMIHIENKVYRINAHTGYVFTLPAQYINDNAAITALRNEDLGDDRISRHSVEEDLWEISGLPQPKSGPGSGCPKVPQYNGPHNLPSNDQVVYTGGSSGCQTGWVSDFSTHAEARYRRFGVYFELYLRGWQERWPRAAGVVLSCNPLNFDIPFYHYRINRNNNHTVQSMVSTTQGGNSYTKIWVYNGSNRLCWFYMNGRVGSRTVSSNPWSFTPFAPVYFNYEP